MRFRTTTYREAIAGWERNAARLEALAVRAQEARDSRELAETIRSQMKRKGKRLSSAFYGLEEAA